MDRSGPPCSERRPKSPLLCLNIRVLASLSSSCPDGRRSMRSRLSGATSCRWSEKPSQRKRKNSRGPWHLKPTVLSVMKLRFHWMMPKGGEVAMKTAQETSRVATTKSDSPAALPDLEGWVRFAKAAEEAGIESTL